METKGPTLEEIVKIIDGPDAQVAEIDLGNLNDDRASEKEASATIGHKE